MTSTEHVGVNRPGQKPTSRQPPDGCERTSLTPTPLPRPTQSTNSVHAPTMCTQSGLILGTHPRQDGPPVGEQDSKAVGPHRQRHVPNPGISPVGCARERSPVSKGGQPLPGEGALSAHRTEPDETLPGTPQPVQGRSLP